MQPHARALAAIALLPVAWPGGPAWAQGAGAPQDAPAQRPRSVLFYLIDTCRADRVSFGGYGRRTTPFLEWLAERSVVFEACSSQAPWTNPSMASMLSSQYPSTTGVYRVGHRLPEELVTWPEVLQANGLYTAGFSANIVMGNSLSNLAQGFDHFVESTEINRADPIRFASGSAKKLNEHAFAWLERTDHWPMLLYLHSVDPHEEYEPEPQYLEQLADPARHPRFREEWQRLLASRPPIPGLYVTQDNFDRAAVDSASFIEHGSDLYDADILANDDELRRLWEQLQEDGWGEDLVLVVTADHGEEFFEHGGTSHGYSLYEELLHVPLLIYAPGLLPAGKRIETPVRSLDIYPTLCALLGLDVPEGLAGESLLPLIDAAHPQGDRAVFAEHREDPVLRRIGHGSGVLVSLRSGRWKLILNRTSPQLLPRPRVELYDLEQDPGEQHDVADAHPDVTERLTREVEAFVTAQEQRASVTGRGAADPAVLAQLRALGYVGEEEVEAPDIWEALASRDLGRIQRALQAGADANRLEEVSGVSPLSLAALAGKLELAQLLLEAGARVDGRNRDGSTPLLSAAFLGRIEVLELLLEEGADPHAKNAVGDTALSATAVPWETTAFVAALFEIPVEREQVEAGREECAALLRALDKEQDAPTQQSR